MNQSFYQQQLSMQKQHFLYRQKQVVDHQTAREITVNGKSYLNFSSNDYLGLNHHAHINQALQEGANRFGICSSGSSLITGFSYAHQALEEVICQWLNKPKALLFNSGFSANSAILQALAHSECRYFVDKLSHASIIDATYKKPEQVKRFGHNNYQHLDKLLSNTQSENPFIVSEGVFSMDGDSADIHALVSMAQQYNAGLYIDDAHSIGVIGEQGQGSCSVNNDIDVLMATCGKAIATQGAFVCVDDVLHDYLVNFAREYIYSTAMSPAMAWATIASIKLIQNEQWRREKISHLSQIFSSTLESHVELIDNNSSIHAIVLGHEERAISIANKMKEKGIWLTAIRPPTVKKGTSRLRVTIASSHTDKDIKHLAESLNRVID